MKTIIADALAQLEKEHQIKVLYACESGSRAWGFPSPDSDYDVRFIYVPELDFYLSLRKRANTIEQMLPGDLDVSGWELAKALKLFAGGNISLFEWLHSPVVYFEHAEFLNGLQKEVSRFFNAKKALFHYLKLAENCMGREWPVQEITTKKILYIARALVCSCWIIKHRSMPATDVHFLLKEEGLIPKDIKILLQRCIVDKENQAEQHKVALPNDLKHWIDETHRKGVNEAESLRVNKSAGPEYLEPLFREWVLRSNG